MWKTREILRLKWQHGRSHRQIAAALAVGDGTASEVAAREGGAQLPNAYEQRTALCHVRHSGKQSEWQGRGKSASAEHHRLPLRRA